jgi:hypothetical protein
MGSADSGAHIKNRGQIEFVAGVTIKFRAFIFCS